MRRLPWIIAPTLTGPVLAVGMGQLLRVEFCLPNFDAPLRITLCAPVFSAISGQGYLILESLVSVCLPKWGVYELTQRQQQHPQKRVDK